MMTVTMVSKMRTTMGTIMITMMITSLSHLQWSLQLEAARDNKEVMTSIQILTSLTKGLKD